MGSKPGPWAWGGGTCSETDPAWLEAGSYFLSKLPQQPARAPFQMGRWGLSQASDLSSLDPRHNVALPCSRQAAHLAHYMLEDLSSASAAPDVRGLSLPGGEVGLRAKPQPHALRDARRSPRQRSAHFLAQDQQWKSFVLWNTSCVSSRRQGLWTQKETRP